MADLTPQQRNMISRGTVLVLGLLLVWGGIRCFAKASELRAEEEQRLAKLSAAQRYQRGDYSGANWAGFAGVLLTGTGGLLAAGALTPTSVLHRLPLGLDRIEIDRTA